MTTLYCQVIADQILDGPRECPRAHGPISNFDQLDDHDKALYGWLRYVEDAAPTGHTILHSVLRIDNAVVPPVVRRVILQSRSAADIAAETAIAAEQAEALRKATPVIHDQPHEFPFISILSQSAGKGIGLTATDEGDLVTVEIHASPWPGADIVRQRIAAAVAKQTTARAKARAELNSQIQARLENLERLAGLRP